MLIAILLLNFLLLLGLFQLQLFLKDIIEVALLFERSRGTCCSWRVGLEGNCILLLRLNIDVGSLEAGQWLCSTLGGL